MKLGLFHSVYTISIQRASLMFETENRRKLCRVPFAWILGTRALELAYVNFMDDFNQLFNSKDSRKILQEEVLRMMLFNKINVLLPTLYYGLLYKPNKDLQEFFKAEFGKDPEHADDLYIILQEIKRLSNRYKLLYIKRETEEGKEAPEEEEAGSFALDSLIVNIETILERGIDPRKRLYQLGYYNQMALKIVSQREGQKERMKSIKRK